MLMVPPWSSHWLVCSTWSDCSLNQVTDNLPDLTLVIDIGKSHAKLLWVDDHGMVVDRRSRDNRSVQSPLGYLALDIAGLTDWMQEGLTSSSLTRRCKRVT